MSIIHEALKKVEASTVQGIKESPAKKIRPVFKIYILYLLVVTLGFISANAIFSFLTGPGHKTYTPANKPATQKIMPQATAKPQAPPPNQVGISAPQEESHSELTLNGIFFSEQVGYALINNQIVKEGDKISGATVVRISLEGVDLKYEKSAISLSSQGK
ncbi:MAG: hypothetical protein WCL25_03015 [bacterium]